ncbi:MAG: hypothetical protein A2138_23080 [Deltaproteobacteria bacterium RBG_16_71_12]|nr:MAG: hypothetical protein A2138_23080 [Deltaproteobacteria bacterium RBG_16_71_12]
MLKLTIACVAPIVVMTASLSGCFDFGTACTEEARASVQVTLLDDLGNFPNGVSVTMQQQGQDEEPCSDFGTGGQVVCGYEVEGEITVRASAPGYGPAEETVVVGRTDDGCHVVTEQVTLVLPAYDGN